jgi:hypothetical protein
MINELLEEWAELQTGHGRTVGDIQNKMNREIEIAQSLQQEGYTGELNGFSLQFNIDDRRRLMREMNDRIREITS